MKILWSSNAVWAPTGYGNQTALFVPRLQKLGHDVVTMATYGLSGAPLTYGETRILPAGRDAYGNDVLAADAQHENVDIVITLLDAWIYSPAVTRQFRWCPWLPIDHEPVPPRVVQSLGTAYQPIVYSRFAEEQLKNVGMKPLYVPHGVDSNVFKPMPRSEARKRFNIPDDVFLVGMVAANKGAPSRKAFDQNIRAFAKLYEKHKDVMLYLHTDFAGVVGGEKLQPIVEMAGIPERVIAKPSDYEYSRGLIPAERMAVTYAAMDVLTNATRGEGFGIPIMEAQSCGTPVIVTGATAMPELCKAGWVVPVDDDDKYYSQESYQYTPRPSRIYEAMEAAYQMSDDDRAALRGQARDGALEYDADTVAEKYWKPVLEEIELRAAADRERSKPITISPVNVPEATSAS